MRPCDLGQRQLPQAQHGDELLPRIDVGLDRLLVRQTGHVGLAPQGHRFVRGGERPGCRQVGVKTIHLVGHHGQAAVDAHCLFADQDGVIGVSHASRQIAPGAAQRQLGVPQIHLRRRGGEFELAPRLDELIDKGSLSTGDAAVVRRRDFITDGRIGIGACLNQVSTGRLDVGGRLPQLGAVGRRKSAANPPRCRGGPPDREPRSAQPAEAAGWETVRRWRAAWPPVAREDGMRALRSPGTSGGTLGSNLGFSAGGNSVTAASAM